MTAPALAPAIPSDDAPHLLVVDDDRRIRALLLRFLLGEGYRVTTAETARDRNFLFEVNAETAAQSEFALKCVDRAYHQIVISQWHRRIV